MLTTQELYELLDRRRAELALSHMELGRAAFGRDDNAGLSNIRRGSSPTYERLCRLAEALGWEVSIGPPAAAEGRAYEVVLDGRDFAPIPIHEATLAAGDGASNCTEDVIGHIAFRKSWLKEIGVSAAAAVLARATGDSMAPGIRDGDMLLIDRSRTDLPKAQHAGRNRRPPPIYAILDDGCARVKRIERSEDGVVVLLSDNPSYPSEVLSGARVGALQLIGRVMWWGHTEK